MSIPDPRQRLIDYLSRLWLQLLVLVRDKRCRWGGRLMWCIHFPAWLTKWALDGQRAHSKMDMVLRHMKSLSLYPSS